MLFRLRIRVTTRSVERVIEPPQAPVAGHRAGLAGREAGLRSPPPSLLGNQQISCVSLADWSIMAGPSVVENGERKGLIWSGSGAGEVLRSPKVLVGGFRNDRAALAHRK